MLGSISLKFCPSRQFCNGMQHLQTLILKFHSHQGYYYKWEILSSIASNALDRHCCGTSMKDSILSHHAYPPPPIHILPKLSLFVCLHIHEWNQFLHNTWKEKKESRLVRKSSPLRDPPGSLQQIPVATHRLRIKRVQCATLRRTNEWDNTRG